MPRNAATRSTRCASRSTTRPTARRSSPIRLPTARYNLTPEQRAAVASRNVLGMIAAGAQGTGAHEAQRTYHIPISNTAAAVMLLETDATRGLAAQAERIAIAA